MPSQKTGLLIHFDEERRGELIQDSLESAHGSFSDALSVRDWQIGEISISLLCFSDSSVSYISLARKGKRVVTSKFRIEFYALVPLEEIVLKEIEEMIGASVRQYFVRSSQGQGGVIPAGTWQAVLQAIKSLRPGIAGDIDRLTSLRRYSGFRLQGESAELLALERDALGISLDIFAGGNKLRNSVLSQWAPREEALINVDEVAQTAQISPLRIGRASFLSGIPTQHLQEESAIQHDLFNWPGMTGLHEGGVSTFSRGDRQLSVVYANRNDLEHTLGVDLIYYNEPYEQFVLVQYKLMQDSGGKMMYRPDAQLHAELSRMDSYYHATRPANLIVKHEEYRLSDDGFFVKFVPNKGLRPASGELVRGLYIPREYMHFLVGPHGPSGPRGGSYISLESAPRHLTNSQFIDNVNCGLLGTRGVATQTFKDMVKTYYETGRALLVAHETNSGHLSQFQ